MRLTNTREHEVMMALAVTIDVDDMLVLGKDQVDNIAMPRQDGE